MSILNSSRSKMGFGEADSIKVEGKLFCFRDEKVKVPFMPRLCIDLVFRLVIVTWWLKLL